MRTPILRSFAAVCGLLAAVGAAAQSDFPVKPVRLIIGYSPGGATDAVGRLLARAVSERWSQPMVVENRPGAAGNIAADLIAKAPAQGGEAGDE